VVAAAVAGAVGAIAMVLHNALDDLGSLLVELQGILFEGLLFAVVQIPALVVFQQTVVVAVMPLAECTIARYPLSGRLTVAEAALDLPRRHVCGVGVYVWDV
jgi:hypothetical protein